MKSNRTYEIGNHLRRLRKQNHLTLEEVSKQLGMSTKSLSYYELGERNIRVSVLESLATIYHTTVDQILIDSKIQ